MGGPPQRQPEIDCKNKKASCKNTGWVRLYAEFVCKGLGYTADHKVLVKLRMLLREESMVFRLCMGQTASSLLGLVIDNEKQGIPPEKGHQGCELTAPWDPRRAGGTGSISPRKQKPWEECRLRISEPEGL